MTNATHHTYILASKRRGALFIGTASNLLDRVLEHKGNLIEGLTSLYAIHQLVYFERFNNAGHALIREAERRNPGNGVILKKRQPISDRVPLTTAIGQGRKLLLCRGLVRLDLKQWNPVKRAY
jgi:predicted GIY-YIG superfamily endonuclease